MFLGGGGGDPAPGLAVAALGGQPAGGAGAGSAGGAGAVARELIPRNSS